MPDVTTKKSIKKKREQLSESINTIERAINKVKKTSIIIAFVELVRNPEPLLTIQLIQSQFSFSQFFRIRIRLR